MAGMLHADQDQRRQLQAGKAFPRHAAYMALRCSAKEYHGKGMQGCSLAPHLCAALWKRFCVVCTGSAMPTYLQAYQPTRPGAPIRAHVKMLRGMGGKDTERMKSAKGLGRPGIHQWLDNPGAW